MDVKISPYKKIDPARFSVELSGFADGITPQVETLTIHNVTDKKRVMEIYAAHNLTPIEKTVEFLAFPIRAPQVITEDVVLQSLIPKENPEAVLTSAKDIIGLKDKPIGEMLFNILVVVADIVTRLDKLDRPQKKTGY